MRTRALLLPALLLSLLPAGAASACHGGDQYVDTLSLAVSAPAAPVRAGSVTKVTAAVTRGVAPAPGVDVYLRLDTGGDRASYASGHTGADGRTELLTLVPRDARGPLTVTVEAFSELATVPCYGTVVEHGLTATSWGRAAR